MNSERTPSKSIFSSFFSFFWKLLKVILILLLLKIALVIFGNSSEQKPSTVGNLSSSKITYANGTLPEKWLNKEYGAFARFPTRPVEHDTVNSVGTIKTFQTVEQYANGGALFSVTINDFRQKAISINAKKLLQFLDQGYFNEMKGISSTRLSREGKFLSKHYKREFEFEFLYLGIHWKTIGFWTFNDGVAYRVSISFEQSLGSSQNEQFRDFLDSFFLIEI